MITRKSYSPKGLFEFAGHHLSWLTLWMTLITVLYHYTRWEWITIPWLPVSVIGTAVAFYVGFKNNQAYNRLWEARKIWGGIVNSSRTWGSMIKAYITGNGHTDEELYQIKKTLIHRHIAWLYTVRQQLLVPTQWEHVSLGRLFGKFNQRRRKHLGVGIYQKEEEQINLKNYLPVSEYNHNTGFANVATQLIDKQTQELARLNKEDALDLLRQIELQKVLNDFYDQQGKAERIKRFPLPRQYGSLCFLFVCAFIFLLPFGIVGEFSKLGGISVWLAIPFGVLIGWVYVVMELIGDYSENPFEGLAHDVPMLSICRTIEIDLLQMLGETNTPPAIQPRKGILM